MPALIFYLSTRRSASLPYETACVSVKSNVKSQYLDRSHMVWSWVLSPLWLTPCVPWVCLFVSSSFVFFSQKNKSCQIFLCFFLLTTYLLIYFRKISSLEFFWMLCYDKNETFLYFLFPIIDFTLWLLHDQWDSFCFHLFLLYIQIVMLVSYLKELILVCLSFTIMSVFSSICSAPTLTF